MCSVSDKIVLCTCEVKDIEELKHYWVLFRYDPLQGEYLIGEPIGWDYYLQEKDPHNPVLLCNKLNEGNLFDKPIDFKEKDRLLISFLFKGNEGNTDYGFEYKNNQWRVIDFEYFDWRADHKELLQGKIKNATAKNNN